MIGEKTAKYDKILPKEKEVERESPSTEAEHETKRNMREKENCKKGEANAEEEG